MQPVLIEYFNDAWQIDPQGLNFRGVKNVERAAGSNVIERAWVRWSSAWGGVTGWKVVALAKGGKPLAEADTRQDYWELPDGARFFTVEGRREHRGTVVSADLLLRAK